MSDDLIDIYVDGRFWTRMPRDEFEREYAASRPMHLLMREAEAISAAFDQQVAEDRVTPSRSEAT